MRVTKDDLDKIVDKFDEEHTDSGHIYVVMRWGYTEKEMLNSPYQLQLLMYDDYERVWEIDWWEGEEYIDFFGIYTDDDFVRMAGATNNI